MTSRFVLLALLGTALGSGCGEEPIPAAPTFELDIKPIMQARCVRCHGAGGTLNVDPLVGTAPGSGHLDHFEDRGDCTQQPNLTFLPSCQRGALYEASAIKIYIHLSGTSRMPPPPAEPLTDRQLAILDRWLANPLP